MQIFIPVRARRASLVPRVFQWEFAKNCVLYEEHVRTLDCFFKSEDPSGFEGAEEWVSSLQTA